MLYTTIVHNYTDNSYFARLFRLLDIIYLLVLTIYINEYKFKYIYLSTLFD